MVQRREHEAEAERVDRLRDPFRRLLEGEPERLEDVRGARDRAHGAVSVLCNSRAGRRRHEGGGRGDVERSRPVAAGPHHVDDVVARGPDGEHVLSHRLRAARDLVRRLALRPERDEKAADLSGRRLPAHDLAHHLACIGPREVPPVEQLLDRLLDHRRSLTRQRRLRAWRAENLDFGGAGSPSPASAVTLSTGYSAGSTAAAKTTRERPSSSGMERARGDPVRPPRRVAGPDEPELVVLALGKDRQRVALERDDPADARLADFDGCLRRSGGRLRARPAISSVPGAPPPRRASPATRRRTTTAAAPARAGREPHAP